MSETVDLKELQKKYDKLETELELYKSIASLPSEQRAYYDTLGESDRAEFLKSSNSDREQLAADFTKKADEASEVVYTSDDGKVFTKKHDPMLVQLAKDRDSDRRELKKSQDKTLEVELRKRAGEVIPNLGKSEETRYQLMKGVMAIADKNVREDAIATLKTCNSKFMKAFDRVSVGWTTEEKPADEDKNSVLALCKRGEF